MSTPEEHKPEELDSAAIEALDGALAEIEASLRQMLLLAELSAGDTNVDREWLQTVLDRLRNKIDRIADQM